MRTSLVPRVKRVFMGALAQPRGCREDFIRRECTDDPEVGHEALRLLRLRTEVTDRTQTQVPDDDATPPLEEGLTPRRHLRLVREEPSSGDVLFERYVLGDPLGAGGFGTVFRARDTLLACDVAVKTVSLASPRACDWHRREVASLLRAQIPGVVELRATSEVDGWGVVVMTLIEGAPFPGRGVAPGDVTSILPRAAALVEAVGYLHAAGVLHRDLKPANVLVEDGGKVTLVDLGIAEDASDAEFWNQVALVGTPTYMAPEVAHFRPASVRSDLYSAAVIIVEAITGEVPDLTLDAPRERFGRYSAEARALLQRVLPDEIFDLLASALDDDPAGRPADVRVVAEALRGTTGTADALDMPDVDDGGATAALVSAARNGRSLDLVGVSGSGRSRILDAAGRALEREGFLVLRVGVGGDDTDPPTRPPTLAPAPDDDEDEDAAPKKDALARRSVADGAVVVADDFEDLDDVTQRLVTELRGQGAVIRSLFAPIDGADHVRTGTWTREDLQQLVRSPERLFHLRSTVADILVARTAGNAREVTREIRSWCRMGLARWDGLLEVEPRALPRLRGLAVRPAARDGSVENDAARQAWNALSMVGAPLGTEALADVLVQPVPIVDAVVRCLVAEGLVARDGDGLLRPLAASPFLADVPDATRHAWSERVAKHLPAASEARFRHLVTAGDRLGACRTAREVARSHMERGHLAEAIAVLDPALSLARACTDAHGDLLADLLGLLADASINRHQAAAVQLALHHANLAPDHDVRVEGWRTILAAAQATLDGNPLQALTLIDQAPSLPTELHQRLARSVAQHSARMTHVLDLQRATVAETARWARRTRGREARSFLASSVGWLRYEEARFDRAYRRQAFALRCTLRVRMRLVTTCNAALAAIEAGDLDAAETLARSALGLARTLGETIHEARAELLLRQALYRKGVGLDVDTELLEAAELLDAGAVRGALRLNEAAVAWRSRRLRLAADVALGAASDLRQDRLWAAALLSSALVTACGQPAPGLAELLERVRDDPRPVGLVAQAVALLDADHQQHVGEALLAQALTWSKEAMHWQLRREVLSPAEVAERSGRRPMPPEA